LKRKGLTFLEAEFYHFSPGLSFQDFFQATFNLSFFSFLSLSPSLPLPLHFNVIGRLRLSLRLRFSNRASGEVWEAEEGTYLAH
jgi:hypothetical protein